MCRSTSRRKAERDRASHDIALDLREQLDGACRARRHRRQGGRAAARPAGAGDAAGRDLRPRCRDPPRRRRQGARGLRQACPSSSMSTTASARQTPRLRVADLDQDNLEFHKVEEARRLRHAAAPLWRHRRSAIRTAAAAASRSRSRSGCRKARAGDGRARPDHAGPGQRPARRARRGGTGRCGAASSTKPSSFPIFRHNGRAAEMVTAELAGAFEAPLYGMLAVGRAHRHDGLDRPAEARDRAARPARSTRSKPVAAVGRRMGGDLGHLPRHGRRLRRGAAGHLHPGRGAVRLVQAAAGDPDARSR